MESEQNSILIIDDDNSMCQSLSMIFSKKGYVSATANSAEEAHTLLMKEQFNLAILDIRLPDAEGITVLAEFKKMYPDMAVFMISGFASVENVAQALNNEADAVLVKPLDMDEVLNKINTIFEKQHLIKKRREAEDRLRHERTMFDTFLENIPDAVYFKDKKARFVRTSKALSDMLKTTPEEMTGKTDEDFFSDEFAAIKLHDDLLLMKEGTPIINKEEKDTSDRWVSTSKLPWYDADGNIIGMFGMSRDITKQKRAEEQLKRSEQLYRSVIDNIGIGVAVINPKMEILTLNNQMRRWFPVSQESKLSVCYQIVNINMHNTPCENCPTAKTLRDGKLHVENLTHNGNQYFRIISTPIFDMMGNVIAAVELVEDVTERVHADEQKKKHAENLEAIVAVRTKNLKKSFLEIKEARDRINAILKSVAEGIIVTDNENRVIQMNRASERLLQVQIEDVLNRPLETVVNNEKLLEYLKSSIQDHKFDTFTFEIDYQYYIRYLQARVSEIQDDTGTCSGTVISFHDITREHEIDRMKTEFISTAAHELRTPLTSIMGFSEILLNRNDISQQEIEKYLGYINKQSVRLANIINDILDISRIESGKGFELNLDKTDINEIIHQVSDLYTDQKTIHSFQILLPDTPVLLRIDNEKIEQLLKNIISNAVKYSPDGGNITIRGEAEGDTFCLTVQDEGIGMSDEQVERIFDKFYRADSSNTAIEGTGLGMSIAKQIVEAHGGKIDVSSILGTGTTVTITFPNVLVD